MSIHPLLLSTESGIETTTSGLPPQAVAAINRPQPPGTEEGWAEAAAGTLAAGCRGTKGPRGREILARQRLSSLCAFGNHTASRRPGGAPTGKGPPLGGGKRQGLGKGRGLQEWEARLPRDSQCPGPHYENPLKE